MEIPIDYNAIKNIAENINPEIKRDIALQLTNSDGLLGATARNRLAEFSEEAWIDFVIGVLLMSITVGYINIYK